MRCGVVSSGPLVVLSVGSPGQPVIVVPLGGNEHQSEGGKFAGRGGGTLPKSAGGGGRSDNNDNYDGLPRGATP